MDITDLNEYENIIIYQYFSDATSNDEILKNGELGEREFIIKNKQPMTIIPKKTNENSLYLIVKQGDFDAILKGTKGKKYRDEISMNTVTKYLEYQVVDGEVQLLYYPDLLSEEDRKAHV